MSGRIKRQGDVTPERGEREYGDVAFADPVTKGSDSRRRTPP